MRRVILFVAFMVVFQYDLLPDVADRVLEAVCFSGGLLFLLSHTREHCSKLYHWRKRAMVTYKHGHHTVEASVENGELKIRFTDSTGNFRNALSRPLPVDDWDGAKTELEMGAIFGQVCPDLVAAIIGAVEQLPPFVN